MDKFKLDNHPKRDRFEKAAAVVTKNEELQGQLSSRMQTARGETEQASKDPPTVQSQDPKVKEAFK